MLRVRRGGLGWVGVLSLVTLGTTGCSRGRDNAQVASEVQNRIGADQRLLMTRVQARATDGIVTLSGYVASSDQRSASVQDAAQIEGVRVVVDNLRTIDPNPQSPIAVVQKPSALIVQPATRSISRMVSKAPIVSRADAVPATSPGESSVRTAPAQPVPVQPVGVVPAVSALSDMHSIDSPAPPPAVAAPPAAPEHVTVPYGTVLTVRLTESVSSDLNQQGDVFLASLASPVMIGDRVVIPAEAGIQGKVVKVQSAGRFSGRSALVVELNRLAYNGSTYELSSSQYSKQGASRDTRAAATIGGGAGVGAIIGAILGGGKGAAIGAMIGAGAGTGVQAASKATQVQLPAEATLSFRLEAPLTVIPSSTLQGTQSTGSGSSQDPFSSDEDRPVLKRRPGSPPPDPDTNTPVASPPSDNR